MQDERMAVHQQGNKQKLKPVPTARKLLAGGHQRDRKKADPQERWDDWEVCFLHYVLVHSYRDDVRHLYTRLIKVRRGGGGGGGVWLS